MIELGLIVRPINLEPARWLADWERIMETAADIVILVATPAMADVVSGRVAMPTDCPPPGDGRLAWFQGSPIYARLLIEFPGAQITPLGWEPRGRQERIAPQVAQLAEALGDSAYAFVVRILGEPTDEPSHAPGGVLRGRAYVGLTNIDGTRAAVVCVASA